MEVARYKSGLSAHLPRTGPDPLDCEAISIGPGSVRQRIRSHDRTLDTRNRQSNGQVLARQIRRQRSSVFRYQVKRGDIFALAHFLSQAERAKAWPCGTWVGGRPLDICGDPVDLFLEVFSPVVGQCRDTHDAPQPLEIVPVAGIEPRDLRERYGNAGSFD